METIDFAKSLKDLYTAKPSMKAVAAPSGTFLAVDGRGEPGGETFQQSIQALFSAVYAAKFALKAENRCDFKVAKLECAYLSDPAAAPRTEWQWRLMIRVPDELTAADLAAAKKVLKEKREIEAAAVKRLRCNEGPAVQILHVGPYDRIGETCRRLGNEAQQQGFQISGPVHEIYLSDPRRTAGEDLKTIVRFAVKGRKRGGTFHR